MAQFVAQTTVVPAEQPKRNQRSLRLSLFDEDGNPVSFGAATKGDKGDPGDQGPKGDPGDPGAGGALGGLARGRLNSSATPSVGWQKIPIDTADFDTESGFDLPNSRYMVPATGYYLVNANVTLAGQANLGVGIYKNGASVSAGSSGKPLDGWAGAQVSDIVHCTADDYLELWCYCDSTAHPFDTETFTNYMSIVQIA